MLNQNTLTILIWLLLMSTAKADGAISADFRITSKVLGYDLQYRIYLPEGHDSRTDYPVLFLTDGQNYLSRGHMDGILNELIGKGDIEPVIAVFVDPRDPDDLESNRRRTQFLCNADYLEFFTGELIPAVERDYPVIKSREGRTIMGMSFGGTNAACFGAMGFDAFSGIAMQSPANHPVPNLLPVYQQLPTLPLRIFLSTGTPNDNTQANRHFHAILKEKGYDMKYVEVEEGHNWDNWGPLIDDVLLFFYGLNEQWS
jgi:enterochelin esterase-like enzyme